MQLIQEAMTYDRDIVSLLSPASSGKIFEAYFRGLYESL